VTTVVKVKYPARIIADRGFIEWLITHDKMYFLKLTHIKLSSIDHKREHNVILESDAEEILKGKQITETTLGAAFKRVQVPKFVSELLPDKTDQMVILAMIISNESPYMSYIFTTRGDLHKYHNSKHLKGVKSVSIKCELDAVTIIDLFYKEFVCTRGQYKDT
jgi:hypothetical protein